MKGLLLKDMLVLRKQFKSMALVFVFYAVMGFAADNYNFLSAFVPVVFILMVLTCFNYDEAAKWNGLALSMPVTRSQLVLSKYLLSLILGVLGFLASTGYGYFMLAILRKPVTADLLIASVGSSAGCLLLMCFLLPAVFRLGVEKSRYLMCAFCFIPFFLAVAVEKLGLLKNTQISPALARLTDGSMKNYLIAGGIAFILILAVISMLVSIQIAKKQEY